MDNQSITHDADAELRRVHQRLAQVERDIEVADIERADLQCRRADLIRRSGGLEDHDPELIEITEALLRAQGRQRQAAQERARLTDVVERITAALRAA